MNTWKLPPNPCALESNIFRKWKECGPLAKNNL